MLLFLKRLVTFLERRHLARICTVSDDTMRGRQPTRPAGVTTRNPGNPTPYRRVFFLERLDISNSRRGDGVMRPQGAHYKLWQAEPTLELVIDTTQGDVFDMDRSVPACWNVQHVAGAIERLS